MVFLLCLLTQPGGAQYIEISQAAGIDAAGRFGGLAFGDFDGDGWDDLYICAREGENKLYRNRGDGTFADVSKTAGVNSNQNTRLAIWGDLNNDGYPELYLGNENQPDVLFLNNGNGTFTDIAWDAGIYNPANPFSVSMADVNQDGWLDIYVANFKTENKLYLNNGNLTFSDYTFRSGALSARNAMATLFFDYDNDRDLDLYLVHDGQPNLFYQNTGDGRFTEISEAAGVADPGFGMGADAGDINNDGWLDLYVTNLYENKLYLNNGDGTFSDISKTAGVDDYGMGWGTNFLDFNNDGWLDIYVANDSYFSAYPNVLYQNNGDLTFQIVEAEGPVSSKLGGYGSACADINLDGRIDIALSNTGRSDHNQLFQNNYPADNWVGFRLTGTSSNRDAVGARIEVWDNLGVKHIEEIAAGSSFASQNSLLQHFGLGAATGIDSARILWPNGLEQQISALEAGYYYQIVEDGAPVILNPQVTSTKEISPKRSISIQSVFPNPAVEQATIRFSLLNPAHCHLNIFDIHGRKIKTLAEKFVSPGEQLLLWDGRDDAGHRQPAGVYFVTLVVGDEQVVQPLVWQE